MRTPDRAGQARLLHRLRALGVAWGRWPRGGAAAARSARRGAGVGAGADDPADRARRPRHHGRVGGHQPAARAGRRGDARSPTSSPCSTSGCSPTSPMSSRPVVARLAAAGGARPDIAQVIDTLVPLARRCATATCAPPTSARCARVFDGLVVHVVAGVVGACRSLDDDAAAVMVERIAAVQAALGAHRPRARTSAWPAVLDRITGRGRRARPDPRPRRPPVARRRHVGPRPGRAAAVRALSFGTPAAAGRGVRRGLPRRQRHRARPRRRAARGDRRLGLVARRPTRSTPRRRCCAARSAASSRPSAASSAACWPRASIAAEPARRRRPRPARVAAAMATVRHLLGVPR